MAWRYCACGFAQSAIDLEDLERVSWGENEKVSCSSCGEPRPDDTPELRINILLLELLELRKKVP